MIPALGTPRLRLRSFRPDDAPAVAALAGRREIAETTLNVPHPYTRADAEGWIATHARDAAEGRAFTFAIASLEDELLGAIGLHLVAAHRRADLGYWIGLSHWGRGFATEAGLAVLDFGFDTLGLNRIEAHCFVGNRASARVLEKLGMRFEGTLRHHVLKDGTPRDGLLYARLASDPRPAAPGAPHSGHAAPSGRPIRE